MTLFHRAAVRPQTTSLRSGVSSKINSQCTMDTQKFVLFLIFSTSMLFLWEAWQKEQRLRLPLPAIEGSANQPSAGSAGRNARSRG